MILSILHFISMLYLVKVNSAFNPLVYAGGHPAYREALAETFPFLGIGKKLLRFVIFI